ncbi:MAG: dCTP deaminase [Candidatus Micrarchaeota archaeon]|nr:dCTP deaminase [Candidatus Micrarchaeota archaeon]MDE1847637.1 dCTP deaminase [Candidatus Micrarchaeota archaeon]MDE1864458.1 dCTP deaminase [Candidatus Micrarchaeota archaeon]
MILSDFDLKNMIASKRLLIDPFSESIVRENGVDFRLADEIGRHKQMGEDFVMDPSDKDMIGSAFQIEKEVGEIVVKGKEQVLLSTNEFIGMPDDVVGFVELRSTWARHGLSMPPTIIDAGFKGTITLEVINNAPYKIRLRPMTRFAHIVFIKATSRVENAYQGNYNSQRGVRLPKPVQE